MSSLLPILAIAVLAAPPSPDDVDLSYRARSTIVTTLDPSLDIYAAPPGIGFDGVAGLLITKPTGTFLCTGSLYGAARADVVTAAHCLTDATSVDAVFFPPVGPPIIETTATYTIRSGYTGEVIDPNDIAVVELGGSVDGLDTYDFFTGDAVGEVYTEVGFGRSGTGATGATIPAGLRRKGNNRFDFTGADPVWGGFWGGHDILFADFDSGAPGQDASCRLAAFFTAAIAPYCDLGEGAREIMSAPGDSGGPLFIDGRIAAVASFGITFTGGVVGDIDLVLNSSFGEFGGYVPIAPHAEWLAGFVSVPEPTTILLLVTGLLGMMFVRRRQDASTV